MKISIIKNPAPQWVNQLPSSSALLDKDLRLIDASKAWFNTFDLKRTSVLGKPFMELFPSCNETWQDSFEYALEGLSDIKIRDAFVNSEGLEQDFIWNINPWKDGYGNPVGIILNIKHVTEKKEALELELNHTQKLLNEKGAVAKIGSWDFRVAAKKMYWSNELKEIFQVPKSYEASIQDTFGFFASEEDRITMKKLLQRAISWGKPWNKNLKIKTDKGELVWINTIGRPKFKNGKCVRIIGTIQNIEDSFTTEAKTTKAVSSATNPWGFINDLPIGAAVIDLATGTITELNAELTNLLGLPKESLINKHFKSFLWFTNNEQLQWSKSLLANNCIHGLEKEVFTKDKNQKIILRISGKRLKNIGDKEFLLATCEDITAFQTNEALLRKELATANAELGRLTHFAHMVSQNLKAQATNFDLLLNFLNNEQDEKERTNLLNILFQSAENLTSSIKGLRELVTIRHQMNEQKKPVAVNDIVYTTIQSNNGLIKQHNVKIHNELTDDFKINAIPVYVESIISNLLVNAIKFKNNNEKPYVIIASESLTDYDVISIEDNAAGIDLSKHGDKLFQLYKTLQNMDNSSGMGLYLAKYQIELMGGKITVDSELDKGSVFKIYFPKKK